MNTKEQHKLPETLTPAEVAQVCNVSRSTVYNWIREGELPTLRRLGRKISIPADAVLRVQRARK